MSEKYSKKKILKFFSNNYIERWIRFWIMFTHISQRNMEFLKKKSKCYSKLNIMLGFVMMWQQVNEERPIDGFTLTAEICANRTTPSLLIDLFPELSWICTPLKGHLWWKKCQLQILIQWIYNWAIPLSTVIENFIFFCQKQ